MTSAAPPAVLVVVVTYHPGAHLDTFLDSVPGASAEPVPIVVSDNGGGQDPRVVAAAARRGVRVLVNPANLGYGAAANAAAAGAAEPWLLVANPDVVLGPRALDDLLAAADRWPGAGALGPLITTPDGQVYPSARELPSLVRGIGHAVFGWIWPTNPWTTAYRREAEGILERTAGWLSGSCLLVRREAFEAVGGFDPGFFMYFEDTDLCQRLARAGWQIVYAPTARVVHAGGHATVRHREQMSRAHHTSAYRYLSGRYDRRWQAPLRAVLWCGLQLRFQLSRVVTGIAGGARLRRRPAP